MASRHCITPLRGYSLRSSCSRRLDVRTKSIPRSCLRSLTTEASSTTFPTSSLLPPPKPTARMDSHGLIIPSQIPSHILKTPEVLTTVYSWPAMEPLRFEHYPHTHLAVPLRRDLLHKAVIFEGDKTRQGTASTKWRDEVRGSGRKVRPQKGTGRARLGDKKSPMLKGGGVAHGPQPRNFATKLPKKMYHQAWRMALSYRYRRGQLIVVDDLKIPENIEEEKREYWLKWVLDNLGWSRGKQGHSFFISAEASELGRVLKNIQDKSRKSKEQIRRGQRHSLLWGRYRTADQVDVKNLLEMKRLVIEEKALQEMLRMHQSDLRIPMAGQLGEPFLHFSNASRLRHTGQVDGTPINTAGGLSTSADFASTVAAAAVGTAAFNAHGDVLETDQVNEGSEVVEFEGEDDEEYDEIEDEEFEGEEEWDEDEESAENGFAKDTDETGRRWR